MSIPLWVILVIILILAWPVQYKIFGNLKSYSDYIPGLCEIITYLTGVLIVSISLIIIYMFGRLIYEIVIMLIQGDWLGFLNKEIIYIH